jgi:riboflavin synthase
MFTGLVQEIGNVTRVHRSGASLRWTIRAPQCAAHLKTGDSINVAGVCQTVESVNGDSFAGTAIAETLAKTTFADWKVRRLVNLELALRADDRLGGHIVSGHIDTVGRVVARRSTTDGMYLGVSFPEHFDPWCVAQGSIALDGVSLTIAEKYTGRVVVALIPETLRRTTLGTLTIGDHINMEFDQLVKAAVQQMESTHSQRSRIDANLLTASGW